MRRGAAALGFLFVAACGATEPPIELVRVQRDLLDDLAAWEVLEAPAGHDPRTLTLALALDPLTDSGDLPAIVLTPPTRVRLTLPASDPAAVLRAAAGVHLSVPRKLPVGSPPMRVRFAARLDGREVFDEVLSVRPKARDQRISADPPTWRWLGGKREGLAVEGGSVLELETELLGPPRMPQEELLVGFGGLYTETRRERARSVASPERPNLVLFVMDTERADRTSAFGYDKPTTPHLERLAARGVAYDDAWSTSSWTWPSTASLMTGLDGISHGVTGPKSCYLSPALPTLAKVLQERGFTTGGFSCNPLISPDKNFDAGFERFEGVPRFTASADMMPAVLSWVRANATRRFFLYVHLVDPHAPHRPLPSELERLGGVRPPDFGDKRFEEIGRGLKKVWAASRDKELDLDRLIPAAQRRWIQDVYDACVATGDHHLGNLLDLLDELGLADRTVVAYTADHGEELFDHSLTDHAHTLHPELLRVPLVLAGPGIAEGVRSGARVSNRHLASTLAWLGGADLEAPEPLDLARPDEVPARDLFVHTAKGIWNDRSMMPIFGLVTDDWSLHWASRAVPYASPPRLDPGEGQWKLYDRRADPNEHVDVRPEHEVLARELRARLVEWRDAAERTQPKSHAAGASTRALLRGVGYVDGAEEQDG